MNSGTWRRVIWEQLISYRVNYIDWRCNTTLYLRIINTWNRQWSTTVLDSRRWWTYMSWLVWILIHRCYNYWNRREWRRLLIRTWNRRDRKSWRIWQFVRDSNWIVLGIRWWVILEILIDFNYPKYYENHS